MNKRLKGLVVSTGLLSKIFTSMFFCCYCKRVADNKKTCRVIKVRLDTFKIYILIWDKNWTNIKNKTTCNRQCEP